MSEPVIPQCAACRVAGSNAHCDACPKTPWQEYATSEDGMREYAKAEPVIPERWRDTYASCCQFKPHKCGQCYLMMQLADAEALVAEQIRVTSEQQNDIAEQKTDLILSAAMLLRKLGLDHLKLGEIRTECFDDSHWALMIDAALKQRMEAKKL